MKIMKVVYKAEQSPSYWGEEFWQIGDTFKSQWIVGVVKEIKWQGEDGDVGIWVMTDSGVRLGMLIPFHTILRVYYGEE